MTDTSLRIGVTKPRVVGVSTIELLKAATVYIRKISETGIMQSKSWTNYYKKGVTMEDKLQKFLDKAFAPYGEFPARADVTRELLSNLQEKFSDLKKQGKSDEEAYQATIDSFGDIAEI